MGGASDITDVFLSLVKFKQNTSSPDFPSPSPHQGSRSHDLHLRANSQQTATGRPASPFIGACKYVHDMLRGLSELLKSNRMAYLQTATTSITSGIAPMSERERQTLDTDAEQCLRKCESTISQLQSKISGQQLSPQLLDHRSRVLLHLWDIYGEVYALYFKLKSDRLETSLEERLGYTMSHQSILHALRHPQTHSESRPKSSLPASTPIGILGTNTPATRRGADNQDPPSSSDPRRNSAEGELSWDEGASTDFHGAVVASGAMGLDRNLQEQLRRENSAFQTSLTSMSDDIRQLEQQMIVVSQAQQIIAHNLMQQRDDLDQIHQSTKDATLHISKGNTELEKAAQSGSTFRICILMFLLSMSLLLLLLHRIES